MERPVCAEDQAFQTAFQTAWINSLFSLMASRRALRWLERRNLGGQLSPRGTLSPLGPGPSLIRYLNHNLKLCIPPITSLPRLLHVFFMYA